jgi:outer membrane receptor protein involved in Fe transport
VNFVLKDHFDGLQLRAQGGQSTYGDADSYFISGLWGTNFAEGRGNVAINVEYARRDQAWGDERSWLHDALITVDSDPDDAPNGSDGVPDNVLIHNFHSVTFSNTGTILFGPGSGDFFQNFNCGIATGNVTPTPYNCPYIFQPNGDLVPVTGQRVGIGPNGAFIGGNGEDFISGHQVQITPQLDRYNINLVGHLEASPAFVPFVEMTMSKTKSVGTGGSGPAFIQGNALGDFFGSFGGYNRETISIDNPYLSDQARSTICGIRASRGQTCPDTYRFGVNESMLGLGNRIEEATRNTFRIVAGTRGDLGSNWNYEASVNYGALHEKTKILGNLNTQRMLLAMDAVKDPNSGQIVCRSQIDPSAAFGGTTYGYSVLKYVYGYDYSQVDPNYQARLQKDIDACVPVNVLGGNFTDAQRAYLLQDTTAVGRTKQFDATAFISGDTGKWFSLPGGPIGMVLGAEYRSDNLYYHQNKDVTLGYTFYNSIPTFSAPASNVKEAFGELRLPILRDLPFANELEISGAARVSDYNLGNTGTVWAYNVNGIYSPVPGLRLRGNYAKAVRAPNQVELFSPFGQNFAGIADPCDADNIGAGSATRAANCLAAGVPAGTQIIYTSTLPFKSGGNNQLEAEVSHSITLGGVLTPRFLPGFSASVDYFDIKVKKAIQFLSAQFVVDQCYDLATLDNPFCAFFTRATGDQPGHDQQQFGIIDNSLHVTPFNFAKLRTRGLDVEVAYRKQIGNIGRLDTKVNWSHVFEFTQNIDPSNPTFQDRVLTELGTPEDAFNWNTSLQHGRFTLGYQMRYIGKMVTSSYEDFFKFNPGCTPSGCPPFNTDVNDKTFYPAKFYHDVRFAVDVGPKYNFYLGVDNLTNEKPPYGLSGIGGGSSIYDAIGRFYYAGIVAKFK